MNMRDLIRITDDRKEQEEIGAAILSKRRDIYDERNLAAVNDALALYAPDLPEDDREKTLYRGIYDYWVYGTSMKENFFYDFFHKSHEEKEQYLTFRNRYQYMKHLNDGEYAAREYADKYRCYLHLKEYYHRELIQIADESDYPLFDAFTDKHPSFVVKPNGLGYGWGVHLETTDGRDKREVFRGILQEGMDVQQKYHFKNRVTNYVLEEIIRQPESIGVLHPPSVNCVRLTTVVSDGKVHFFYPRIKVGKHGNFISNAGDTGLLVGIDAETGVCNTDGWDERGHVYQKHPDTNIPLKGFQIPDWKELLRVGEEIALKLAPRVRYVGWDIAYSDKGWTVIEANPNGEFICQLIAQRGLKHELEAILRWSPEKEFWWE